jgi:hypothetical protein
MKFRSVTLSEETIDILRKVEDRIALGFGFDLKTRQAVRTVWCLWDAAEQTERETDKGWINAS